MLRQYRLKDYNFRLILWVLAISVVGIMVIGSALKTVQSKQIMGLVIGLVLMLIFSLIDYTWILHFHWLIYAGTIALLLSVTFFGITVNGAKRWINIGMQFQPSDIAKIGLILFFAKIFTMYEEKISTLKMLVLFVGLLAVPWYLIQQEPDLSTSIVLLLVFCSMIYVAGLSNKIIATMFLIAVPLVIILITVISQPNQTLLKGYQLTRIMAWLNPADYPNESYQQTNSIIAIGTGQLAGKGLSNNIVASVKNGNFIAEPQTDFIFAVAGEELGFIGCCLIIALEFIVSMECIMTGRRARELSGTLICSGMGALILFQSFVNICVATGLMPNTGITLPFVSYGVTSLISFCIGIGIVLNVGLQTRKY